MEVCRRRRVGNRPIANTNRTSVSVRRFCASMPPEHPAERRAASPQKRPAGSIAFGQCLDDGLVPFEALLCALDTTTVGAKNSKDRAPWPVRPGLSAANHEHEHPSRDEPPDETAHRLARLSSMPRPVNIVAKATARRSSRRAAFRSRLNRRPLSRAHRQARKAERLEDFGVHVRSSTAETKRRHCKMQKRTLGKSGLEVSALGFGCMGSVPAMVRDKSRTASRSSARRLTAESPSTPPKSMAHLRTKGCGRGARRRFATRWSSRPSSASGSRTADRWAWIAALRTSARSPRPRSSG